MIAAKRDSMFRAGSMVLLVLFILLYPLSGFAVESEGAAGGGTSDQKIELTFQVIDRDFEYPIEKRPDPFVPFYTGETSAQVEPDPNEIVEVEKRLTGMQLFEPGQLTLVALMKIKGEYVAMVEDFKGQGYIIEEGTKIGRRGTVKDIIPNKVLIEEIALTRAGKELRNEIVMALRKEGEE